MIVSNNDILWSASDLTRAAECEFSLLRQLDVKLGRIPAAKTAVDPLMDRIAEIGLEHEARELARLSKGLAPYDVATGRGVCLIDYPKPYTAALLAERRDQTLAALEAGADLVCQAAFFDGSFHGFADFLIRDGDAYRVCDAKLSRHERPKALLQLAAYADQLTAAGIPLTDDVELLLGNGRQVRFPLSDLAPVFRERRQRLLDLLHGHQAAESPAEWGMPGVLACGRCDVCSEEVAAANDLLLVAGMRMTQRRKLMDAGITTIDQLAAATSGVDGMSASTFTTLHAQAALQVAGGTEEAPVTADVFCPDHLAVIPAPSPGDLFFDFEGDPMWNDGNPDWWGLEYLFGVTEVPEPGAESPFTPFWAHDRAQEKQALEDFIEFVRVRREKHPDLHIYHYAAYEKSALLRLAAKHATCEAAVDELLSAGVLVDLYAVVRGAIRVSAPSYSIKKLEPLYMGDDLREGEVTDAAASIVEYHAYCQARDSGDAEGAAKLLDEIRDYNRYDCESTRRLRDWLLERAAEHGVTPRAAEAGGGEAFRARADAARGPAARGPARDGAHPGRAGAGDAGRGDRLQPARAQAVLVGPLRPAVLGADRLARRARRLRGGVRRRDQGLGEADPAVESPSPRAPGRPLGCGQRGARRRPGEHRLREPRGWSARRTRQRIAGLLA